MAALLVSGAAAAQVSGQAGLVSDVVYRGISVSGGKPAAQLGLAWDQADGAYAGITAWYAVDRPDTAARSTALAYLGYARRMQDWSIDAGITQQYSSRRPGRYRELYIGAASNRLLARLSYSPDYAATGTRTLYAEVGASAPLTPALSLVGRAGFLTGVFNDDVRRRTDASVGLVHNSDYAKIELTLNAVRFGHDYAPTYAVPLRHARHVVLSVIRPF